MGVKNQIAGGERGVATRQLGLGSVIAQLGEPFSFCFILGSLAHVTWRGVIVDEATGSDGLDKYTDDPYKPNKAPSYPHYQPA